MGIFNHSSRAAAQNQWAAGNGNDRFHSETEEEIRKKNAFYASHKIGTYGWQPHMHPDGLQLIPLPLNDDGTLGNPIY